MGVARWGSLRGKVMRSLEAAGCGGSNGDAYPNRYLSFLNSGQVRVWNFDDRSFAYRLALRACQLRSFKICSRTMRGQMLFCVREGAVPL
jgi:hypothetical protein